MTDETSYQTHLLQVNLQKEILEAENKAMQQKILMLIQDTKQLQRAGRDSEEEINRLILALRSANQQLQMNNSNQAGDSKGGSRSGDYQNYSLLQREASLLRDLTEHHRQLFQLGKETDISNLLVVKDDYDQVVGRIEELERMEKDLRAERDDLNEKVSKLSTEKDALISSLECASITEQVIVQSNEKMTTKIKELKQALTSSDDESKSTREENAKLAERLSSATEKLARLESATEISIRQINELKSR